MHYAVHGKTAKSILISCGARLAPFDIQELRDLMKEDELELDTLGIKRLPSLLSSSIPMIPLTLWCPLCIHSYLIFYVIEPMMYMVEGFRFM